MAMPPVTYQIISRKPDRNGNVPRIALGYSEVAHVVFIEQMPHGNIPEQLRGLPQLPTMKLTNSEFREWKLVLKIRQKRG